MVSKVLIIKVFNSFNSFSNKQKAVFKYYFMQT